ncbi:hypothetical protein [Ensifer adhaerens]|uniref:hypothetical protein n=1 Tax=Ensifer adhaerens TaxID=106592 RepID=UPI000FDC88EE|nr:hypothetical protein [Ensifer adhaerens]MDF8359005.1 hypothetical protein [Ensifer adhaerens]THA68371.1 hypothetical protein E5176_05100 [Ensifer adhaerens]
MDALARVSDGRIPSEVSEEAFDFVTPMSVPNFDGNSLVELVRQAPAKTGVIIADAKEFRLAGVQRVDDVQIDEDVWTAHVHQLLVEIDVLCRERDLYVLLDLGWYYPSRRRNVDLLCSVGDVGLAGSPPPGPGADEVVDRVSRLYELSKTGDVGRAVRELEEDEGLSEKQRFFLRLEVFSAGGLHDQVRDLLRGNAEMLAGLPAEQALHVARIAEVADDDDRVEFLINRAIPSIRREGDFQNAFTTAVKTTRRSLIAAVETSFRRFFPNSPMLRSYAIGCAARSGEYGRAAAMLASSSEPEDALNARYYSLLAEGTDKNGWAPTDVSSAVSSAIPDRADEVVAEISIALEREGRRPDAFRFLLDLGTRITGRQVLSLIKLAGNAMQAGEMSPSDPLIIDLLALAVAYLGQHPADGAVRTRLAALMAPTMTADAGLKILVTEVLRRALPMPRIRERPKVHDRPRPIDLLDLQPRIERIWRWLRERGDGYLVIGQHSLPATELDLPAEQVIAGILKLVDYQGDRLADQSDHHVMRLYVAAASAVASLSDEPDDDLVVIRTAGSKLATAGKGQAARDLAELALAGAGDRPERRRQALFTFADIYARLGMKIESLIAFAAAIEASEMITWDEVWFETNLLFRLLRDTGLSQLGLPLLERSREALDALGLGEHDGYRLETLALQAATASFEAHPGGDDALEELLGSAIENAEKVIAKRDDLLPIAMVLNHLLHLAKARRLDGVASAERLIERLIADLPPSHKTLVRAGGLEPTLDDIATLAAEIENARYVDDAGYDHRHLRLMARRLVKQAIDTVDPRALVYAIEATADRGVLVTRSDGASVLGERLLARADAPLEAAEMLSRHGVAITGMALFGDRLATVEFEDGVVNDFTLEPKETFSAKLLGKWAERFPRDYMLEDNLLSLETMRESVAGLGLTKIPRRSVLIADAELQRLPPNLLTIDGNYAGFDHAIGVAPSLEWLAASRKLSRRGDGTARMWIPVSAGPDTSTLTLMRNEVQDLLERENVPLELANTPSNDFADADVAIIGAHGGLAEVNRYFRSLSNDDHVLTDISDVTEVTRRARVTVLFVCSGGRVDPHPETGMAIGLAKQILARGCSSVIAPAWPIPFFMARPWLEGFLRAWRKGELLLDAYHAANLSVAKSSSWDPKRTLAMTLYGDPFVKAG